MNDPLISFERLSEPVNRKLKDKLRVRTFNAGEIIFHQSHSPLAIYLVAHGRVKMVRITEEGYESILCVRGAGDYFCPVPLLDQGDQLGTAIAMTDVTLLKVNQEDFNHLCAESPEFLSIVQGDCLSEVRSLLHRLENFAFRGIRERVAYCLLTETRARRDPGKVLNDLKLTQQELAALVGASRESVSRHLSRMEAEQVVKTGRGRIVILDRAKLEEIAKT
jgi:CRP-like cAMP-binding protein